VKCVQSSKAVSNAISFNSTIEKGFMFTFRANFWQQLSTSQMTKVSSYDEETNILPITGQGMYDQHEGQIKTEINKN